MANKKGRRKLKQIIIALSVLLVAAIVIVLMIPSLLGGPGKGIIVGKINDAIDGSVTIESLSLSWGGPQRIMGLTLSDPDGGEVLSIDSIDAPAISLLGVAGGDMNLGQITIAGLKLNIEESEGGATNLARATTAAQKNQDVAEDDSSSGVPAGLSCLVQLSDAHITLKAGSASAVVADLDKIEVDLTDMAAVKASLQGKVSQDGDGGSLDIDAKIANLFDSAGRVVLADLAADISAEISDVPTALLDRLANQGGVLEALLGKTLTADINARTQGSTRQVTMSIKSPNLKTGPADLSMTPEGLSLKGGLDVELNMTPRAWDAWTSDKKTTLQKPFLVSVGVTKLSIPYVNGKPALARATIEADIKSQDIELQSSDPQIGRVALRKPNLHINAPEAGKALSLILQAVAEQNSQSGGIKLQADLANAVSSEGQFSTEAITGLVTAEIVKAPLAVVDQLLQTDGLLVAALGESLNAKVNANLKSAGDGIVTFTANAEHFNAHVNATISKSAMIADEGSQISLQIQPDLFARYVAGKTIAKAINATLVINTLKLPRTDEKWNMADAAIDATLAMSDVQLPGREGGESMVLSQPSITIKSPRLADNLAIAGSTGINQLIGDILGHDVSWQLLFKPDAPFDPSALSGAFALRPKTPNMAGALAGTYDGYQVVLAKDSNISLTITPQIASQLLPEPQEGAAPMGLAQPVAVKVTFNSATIPLEDVAASSIDMVASIDKLAFSGDAKLQQVLLHSIQAAVQTPSLGKSVHVTAGGQLQHGQQAGSLHVDARIADAMGTATLQQAVVKFDPLPVALVDLLASQNGKLVSLLGETMSVTFDATPKEKGRIAFKADAESARFKLKGSGTYLADESVSFNEGAGLALNLSPQSFAALQGDAAAWRLLSPATITIALTQANLGLPAGDLRTMQLAANVNCDELQLQRVENRQSYLIKKISASLDAADPAKSMRFKVNADLVSEAGSGQVRSDTTISNALDEQGAFSLTRAVIRTKTQTDPLPSSLVIAMLQMEADYAEMIGPTTTLSLIGQYPGNLDLDLQGANTQASARMTFDAKRTMTLREPATATMKVTPALTRVVLGKMHPVLADVDKSKEPLKLTISQLNLPLELLDSGNSNAMIKAASAEMQLDLGTLSLKQSWLLDGLIGQLIKLGARIPDRETVDTRFTPLVMSMRNGVITTNDMWLLSPDAVMGVQGRIDPLSERFDFTVGIGGETFARLGGDFRKVIRPEMIIELQHVSSKGDYKDKTAEIVMQIVKASAANIGGLVGGDNGALLGAILGQVTQSVFKPKGPTLAWKNRPPLEETLPLLGLVAAPVKTPAPPEANAPDPAQQPAQLQPEKSKKQHRREAVENVLNSLFK